MNASGPFGPWENALRVPLINSSLVCVCVQCGSQVMCGCGVTHSWSVVAARANILIPCRWGVLWLCMCLFLFRVHPAAR